MTSREPFSDADIQAYVDGRLDASKQEKFKAWLADEPKISERIEAYRKQNEDFHKLFDPVLDEPVPQGLMAPVTGRRGRPSTWLQITAGLVLILAGAAGGWGLRGLDISSPSTAGLPEYVERAVGAHIVYAAEIRHPVEVDAKQEDHLVAWLSKRLGNPLRAPRLVSAGFELVGGRLLEDAGQPAAQFMYEDQAGRRVTVYVRSHQGKETAFKFSGGEGISAFYWIDAPFAYALAGDISRQQLRKIAHIVYEDLAQ
ncbi:MAG: anti-sigma factor [Alphaproteobacteria bacterium]|nr:anti-sigma factor [Alphaproteobacteria bacterium]